MKRILSVSFTYQGAALQEKLGVFLASQGMDFRAFAKYPVKNCLLLENSLRDFTEKAFSEADGILFVSAAGIAVRAIAPFVRQKDRDPAVLVLDDTGKYVIPILSGHLGGANNLSEQIAAFLGAEAVITTSTDCNALFSVDSFAVKQNAFTVEIDRIKAISSEILKGNPVGFQSDYPVEGKLPPELTKEKNLPVGILISDDREKSPFKTTLHLVPRRIVLGVGCRKNIEYELLYHQMMSALCEHHLTMEQVYLLASVDLKREESAFLRLQKDWKLVFQTFPADALRELKGKFTPSKFVEAQIGVDNVCERAAWLAAIEQTRRWEMAAETVRKSGNSHLELSAARKPEVGDAPEESGDIEADNGGTGGEFPRFLFRKTAGNGVTVAAVELDWRCRFE